MKKMVISVLSLMVMFPSFATVDAHSKIYLVVKDIQTEEFFVERAPIIGCYGSSSGPGLAQFTAEYKVNSNIGCGGVVFQDNINYLTCAKIISFKETADFMSVSEMTLDISKCVDKNNPKLISAIKTAANLNFPLKKGKFKLSLVR
jgi:hypothetical protein